MAQQPYLSRILCYLVKYSVIDLKLVIPSLPFLAINTLITGV